MWDLAELGSSQACNRQLAALCDSAHLHMLVGAMAALTSPTPRAARMITIKICPFFILRPAASKQAFMPSATVPFGEYVPFKESWPWLHKKLLALTPYPDREYGVTPGDNWHRFSFTTRDGRTYRFGTPICYEDCMPYPSRAFVDPMDGHKQVDFLVSISNDGWYRSDAELQQHLQMDQLRAVEERVSFARAVNGGDSGFIDPDGRVIDVLRNGSTGIAHTKADAQGYTNGYAIQNVPLDSRVSLYSRIGDIFPMLCGIIGAVAVGWTIARPRRASFKA